MDHYGNCPKCGESLDDGSILDAYKKHRLSWTGKEYTDEELEEQMKEHYAPPYRYSKLIGIEVMGGYDGISYWQCPFCKATWDRFTGNEVEFNDDNDEEA